MQDVMSKLGKYPISCLYKQNTAEYNKLQISSTLCLYNRNIKLANTVPGQYLPETRPREELQS